MTKIRLLQDLPVDDKHGMTEGRVLNTLNNPVKKNRSYVHWWVLSDDGKTEVGVLRHEAELYTEDK